MSRLLLAVALAALATLAAAQTPPTVVSTTVPAVTSTTVASGPSAGDPTAPGTSPGTSSATDDRPLKVAIVEAPPFAYLDSDGTWTGLSIVLWRVIAGQLQRRWDWVALPANMAYQDLADGRIDVIVGAVAITHERRETVDFSAPYLSGELGVTVPRSGSLGVLTAARRVFTRHLMEILLGLGLSIVVAGTLMWAFERRPNPQHFGGRMHEGIGSGIWWAAVTMTTVGYGDTLPHTRGGRVIALIWMFTSIVVISLFTASVVSMVTLANLRSHIENVEDLRRLRVGAVDGGTGQDFLRHHAIPAQLYPTIEAALRGVAEGEVEAVVGPIPVMRWVVRRQWAEQLLVTAPFLEQDFYAFALRPGDELRRSVDLALLRIIETDDWRAVRERYLGH
jgi:polar amino acid transport system substrate-binding protein